jgi:hypothetical protein
MTHIKFWHVLLLMILIPYLLGSKGCPDNKTDTPPPPTGCGVGDGYYGARIIDGPPSDFYCDLLCCFEIEFEPKMNYTYSGFNRFYFQLKKGSSVYRSNYVQFDSGNWDNQTVEWGGCLENGEYKVTTIMENIQLNSTCEDSIYLQR